MDTLDLTIGIDIGQKHDPTAIAVVETVGESFACRFLERLPLGTTYDRVAERLHQIVTNAERIGRERSRDAWQHDPDADEAFEPPDVQVAAFLDTTGVGTPVLDTLRASGVHITAVYFRHGDRRTDEGGQISLGKAWLVSRLQVLFQTQRLALPRDHPEAAALRQELLDYEIRVSADANDRYGAFRTGAHDDLVTALGLAVQTDRRAGFAPLPGFVVEELERYFGWEHRS